MCRNQHRDHGATNRFSAGNHHRPNQFGGNRGGHRGGHRGGNRGGNASSNSSGRSSTSSRPPLPTLVRQVYEITFLLNQNNEIIFHIIFQTGAQPSPKYATATVSHVKCDILCLFALITFSILHFISQYYGTASRKHSYQRISSFASTAKSCSRSQCWTRWARCSSKSIDTYVRSN